MDVILYRWELESVGVGTWGKNKAASMHINNYYYDASSSSCCYVANYLASIPSFRRLLLIMLCLWEVSLSEGGEELCLSICMHELQLAQDA